MSTYLVRLEVPIYKEGKLHFTKTISEYTFDTYEEALQEYEGSFIEPTGEMLFLDEVYEDGDQDNLVSRGEYEQKMLSTISRNEYICNSCNTTFLDCKCISISHKSDILMSFLDFRGLSMKKVERERRHYFSDNYSQEAPKKRFKFKKVVKHL
tara:strand:- start:27 stop:485 length:459 start_codon:yes stop_codon:yes gene_type:complete